MSDNVQYSFHKNKHMLRWLYAFLFCFGNNEKLSDQNETNLFQIRH